ncbi:MAG TPA: carbohydrate-binding family 9-like protein [Methylomirabilota bacterium]
MYRDPHAPPAEQYAAMRLATAAGELLGADHPAWQEAGSIEWGPERYRTRFQACWDPRALHVRWDAVDDSPWHTLSKRDDHIWNEEVVELFLDPLGTGRDYAELEISPINVVCDLHVETAGPPLKASLAWDWTGMSSVVVPLRDAHGAVEGWTALARLPFEALQTLSPETAGRMPPSPGTAWRFNVFRIKRPGGPQQPMEGVIYAAWSPPGGRTFHEPAAFRLLRFEP